MAGDGGEDMRWVWWRMKVECSELEERESSSLEGGGAWTVEA